MAVGTHEYMKRLGQVVIDNLSDHNRSYDLKQDPSDCLFALEDGQFKFSYNIKGLTSETMRMLLDISDKWDVPVKFFDSLIQFTPKKLPENHTANDGVILPEYRDLAKEIIFILEGEPNNWDYRVKTVAGMIADFLQGYNRTKDKLGL